jgi:hypothetical protein
MTIIEKRLEFLEKKCQFLSTEIAELRTDNTLQDTVNTKTLELIKMQREKIEGLTNAVIKLQSNF